MCQIYRESCLCRTILDGRLPATWPAWAFQRLVVGKILNHAEPGVTKVYDRHSYDAEKRQALNAWAERVMELVTTMDNKVLRLHRKP